MRRERRWADWDIMGHDVEFEFYLEVYGELSKDIKHGSDTLVFYFRKVTFCCMDLTERNQDQEQGGVTDGSKKEIIRLN